MIERQYLNRGRKKTKTIRLTEKEIEAREFYRQHRWLEDNADITFTGALREIVRSFSWETIGSGVAPT